MRASVLFLFHVQSVWCGYSKEWPHLNFRVLNFEGPSPPCPFDPPRTPSQPSPPRLGPLHPLCTQSSVPAIAKALAVSDEEAASLVARVPVVLSLEPELLRLQVRTAGP